MSLSQIFYFIWKDPTWVALFFFILFFVLISLSIWVSGGINLAEKDVSIFKGKKIILPFTFILCVGLFVGFSTFFNRFKQKELDKYTQTVTYDVKDYRIQKMKENEEDKTYYLLKINKGTEIIDGTYLQTIEEDRFTDKKHKIGKVMTYTRREVKGNVPKYKRKVLEDTISEYKVVHKPEYQSIFKIITYKSGKVN